MTTAELTAPQRVHVLSLMYLRFRAGHYNWTPEQADSFLANLDATCAEAGTTAREALMNAAAALESAGRTELLPKGPGRC